MSDAPERIWAWQYSDHETGGKHDCGEWYVGDHGLDGDEVEYRRADLPPTNEECLRNEKVRALVEAAEMARNRLEMIADETWHLDGRGLKRNIKGIFADFDAALADIQEMKK